MEKKELCKVFETEYAAKYNLYIKKHFGEKYKYIVSDKNKSKVRPIYVYFKGRQFSVCFMITSKPKHISTAVKWPKDGSWDDKDRWIVFQPVVIPNTSIWNWNTDTIPEHITKRHYTSLLKMSTNKNNNSKNYRMHLNDAINLCK